MKFRKKPVVVEAVQWNGTNVVEVYNFLENKNVETQYGVKTDGKNFYIKFENGSCQLGTLMIKTLEGEHKASVGDYIIKGVNGEFYPCKPDIFEKTYYPVKESYLHDLSKEESAERATPKKPILEYIVDGYYYCCPICKHLILEKTMIYCVNADLLKKDNAYCSCCGNKIDWSDNQCT